MSLSSREKRLGSLQSRLWDEVAAAYPTHSIPETIREGFYRFPRHLFTHRFRTWEEKSFREVTNTSDPSLMDLIYCDRSLVVAGDGAYDAISTSSQPSFILHLLSLLDIKQGHNVLEVGSGTGWLAAIVGHMVGSTGHVTGIEIIPDLAEQSRQDLLASNATNVTIVTGDGGLGVPSAAPYDRIIFTAGSYVIPDFLFAQLKEDGLVLIPLKQKGISDEIFVLRKKGNTLASEGGIQGSFVPLQGKLKQAATDVLSLNALRAQHPFMTRSVSTERLWWGGDDKTTFLDRTVGFRSFLNIADPCYETFNTAAVEEQDHPDNFGFGLWDREINSLVIAQPDSLESYGTPAMRDQFKRLLHEWIDLGMPPASVFDLCVTPEQDESLPVPPRSWRRTRNNLSLVWKLR